MREAKIKFGWKMAMDVSHRSHFYHCAAAMTMFSPAVVWAMDPLAPRWKNNLN
jgi:hypothetical protein